MAKRNKILLILLLIMATALSTACSDSGEEIKQPSNVDGDTSRSEDSSTTNEDPSTTNGDAVEEPAEITIPETLLYESDGIKVTATGYEDSWSGPEIKLLIENDSDRNILITAESVSANGYMMPLAGLYAEVTAGKKANEGLSLMNSELEQSGIDTLAELQFYLKIQDPDTWEVTATSDLLTLTTSAAPYEQPVDDSGDILYDSNGIRIVCKGLKQDVIWDGTVVFYMENSSGKAVTIYAENVSVNGFMQDVSLWSDLRDGTRLIDGMSMIDLSDLEIESIDQIENIEFNLRIIDEDTWEEIATTDALTLQFE